MWSHLCWLCFMIFTSLGLVSAYPRPTHVTCSLTKVNDPSVEILAPGALVMGVTPQEISSTDANPLVTLSFEGLAVIISFQDLPTNGARYLIHTTEGFLATIDGAGVPPLPGCNNSKGINIGYDLRPNQEIALLDLEEETTITVIGGTRYGQPVYFQRFSLEGFPLTPNPSRSPTEGPTKQPSRGPTNSPVQLTATPTVGPTEIPTLTPTSYPSASPTTPLPCGLDFMFADAVAGLIQSSSDCSDAAKCPSLLRLFQLFEHASKDYFTFDILGNCTALDFLFVLHEEEDLTREEVFLQKCLENDEFSFVFQGKHCEKALANVTVGEFMKAFGVEECPFRADFCLAKFVDLESKFLNPSCVADI